MQKRMTVTMTTPIRMFLSDKGRWFVVRVLPPGARHGLTGSVTEGFAQVEFYDTTFADDRQPGDMGGFGPFGQFVNRYPLKGLLGLGDYGSGHGPVDLAGRQTAWRLDEAVMGQIRAWLRPLAVDYGEDKPEQPPSLGDPAAAR